MAYELIDWENAPSVNTPIDEDNLNHMDEGIKDNNTAILNLASNIETSRIKVGSHLTTAFQGNTALIGKYNDPDNAAILQVANGTSDNDLKNLVTILKYNSVLVECPISITDDLSVTGDITSGGEVTNGAGNKLSEKANQDMFLLTASGSVVSVNAYPSNAKDLKVTMSPIQASGTPSPSNPLPISGRSSVDVFNSPKSDYKDYFVGVLKGTHNFVDLSTLSWTKDSCNRFQTISLSSAIRKATSVSSASAYILCSDYSTVSANDTWSQTKGISLDTQGYIQVYDGTYASGTADAFKTAMSGVYLVYELTTPITPSYTTEQWNALMSAFDTTDYTIALGQTVYGGVLDVTTGVLTIYKALVTYDGSEDEEWNVETISAGVNYYISVSDAKGNQFSPLLSCNLFPATQQAAPMDGYIYISGGKYLNATIGHALNITTVSELRTYLASHNLQICYELVTPTTVQLTPTQIALLEGLNNVFSEDGTVELTYLPESILPPLPTTDGTYTLKATISGGSVSLAWDDGNGNRNLSKGGSEEDPKEEEEIEEPKEDMR